jgi:hypothetical protein
MNNYICVVINAEEIVDIQMLLAVRYGNLSWKDSFANRLNKSIEQPKYPTTLKNVHVITIFFMNRVTTHYHQFIDVCLCVWRRRGWWGLRDHIIWLRREVWAYKTSLAIFYWSACTNQRSERSCIWVLWVSGLPLSTIFDILFANCSHGVLFFVFYFIT